MAQDFTRRQLGALIFGTALAAPLALLADDHDHRYYDRDHKDYHVWNDDENRAYRFWLQQNHREYHDWNRANRQEQREYWRWRHDHPKWEEHEERH